LILPSGEDRPITPDDRVLAEHVLEGRVDGPRGVRRWLAFLGELFRDDADREQRIAYLQEWLGAALFGEATSYRGLPFLVGTGQNGKSALCFAVEDLFAPGAVRHVDPKSLTGDHAEYYVASLEGARALIVPDVSGELLRDTSFLKRIITGDPVSCRRPSEMPRSHVFRVGVLLAGQELPPSADTSDGLASRFLPLRLTRVFRDGAPGVLPPAVLADLLRAERVGVILWAAEGLRRLRRQGAYTCPPSALRERRLWMYGDSAAAWWGEALDFTVPADLRPWRPKAALYALYVEWAKAQRQPVLSAERWVGVFARKGCERQCRRGVTGYRLALSASAAPILVDNGEK
jgi:putative DNA primase/helicase